MTADWSQRRILLFQRDTNNKEKDTLFRRETNNKVVNGKKKIKVQRRVCKEERAFTTLGMVEANILRECWHAKINISLLLLLSKARISPPMQDSEIPINF